MLYIEQHKICEDILGVTLLLFFFTAFRTWSLWYNAIQYSICAGISKLEFTAEQEIIGMVSAENEMVPFPKKIVPAAAKVLTLRIRRISRLFLYHLKVICLSVCNSIVYSITY